jgi:hypothetical protein
MALSSDGKLLFTASSHEPDPVIRAWRVSDGALVRSLNAPGDGRSPAGITALGPWWKSDVLAYIHYSQDSTTVGTWDPNLTSVNRFRLRDRGGLTVFAPRYRWAAMETRNHCIQLYDLELGTRARLLEGHHQYICAMVFAGGSERLITGDAEGGVAVWSWAGGRPIHVQAHKGRITGIAVVPDASAFITGGEDHRLRLWSIDGGGPIAEFIADAPIRPYHVTPDRSTILAIDRMSRVHLLRIVGTALRPSHPGADAPRRPRARGVGLVRALVQLRLSLRRGHQASDRRDWIAAERHYQFAAMALEEIGLPSTRLDQVLDGLEFSVGMRKNAETIAAHEIRQQV